MAVYTARTVTLSPSRILSLPLTVEMVIPMSMLFFFMFQDRLWLVYCFNDAFEEPSDIQMYLEEMKAVLAKELLETVSAD